MSANLPEERNRMKERDDVFVTGTVREHLEKGQVEQLSGGPLEEVWNSYLSYCPFLGAIKNMFLNDVVMAKRNYTNYEGIWVLW